MHTPQERDRNRPTDEQTTGSSGQNPTPNKTTNSALDLKNSSLVRLTAVATSAPDLLADDPGHNTDDFPTVITSAPQELQPPTLSPGTRLGSFELMEAIGAGGMATVIKARDVDLGRIVALKILPPATARDSEAVTRFKLEARAAAKLDHENIARVYFCGEDRNLHFIAFEFVEGENLRQHIERTGRLSPADAIHYLLQLAAGLTHAGERGVVHRDIKPSNILITPEGRAKIVDMGLARHLDGNSVNGGVTQSGVTLGTFDYISPEQALDPRRADIRSDIYSLGCAFYHALTGRPPVPEGTAAKKLHAHEHESPTDPRDLNPAVPDGLAMVLAKMMAKKPDRRYQTPAELIRDLTTLVGQTSGTKSGVFGYPTISLPVANVTVPRLPLIWLSSLAIVAVAAIVYFSFTPTSPHSSAAPWHDPNAVKNDPNVAQPGTGSTPSVQTRPTRIGDARALAESIAKQGDKATIQLRAGAVYDLTTLAEGILATNGEITIEPEPLQSDRSEVSRPILRIAASPPIEKYRRAGTISFHDANRVVIRGIELEIVDRLTNADQPEVDPIGVLFTDVARVEMENCLVRTKLDSRKNRIVGIAVERDSPAKATSFALRSSLLDVGVQSVGLRVVERTETILSEVAFAPHQSAIVWADEEDEVSAATGKVAKLTIESCTFMFDRGGAAITADQRSSCAVSLAASVFADASTLDEKFMMPGTDMKGTAPVVFRSEQNSEAFQLQNNERLPANAYYRVSMPANESRPIALTSSPWAVADPRPQLITSNPWLAFLLNLNEKRLRVNGPPHVIGVTTLQQMDGSTKPIYDGGWPPAKPSLPVKAKAGQRVVHPDATPEDAASRLYPTIAKAYEDLKAGETLLVAQNGRVPVSILAEKSLRATVAAFEGFSPILIASDDTVRRPDASLFPLVDGELTFSGVQIHLSGRAAVVTMAGGTTCTFKNCAITLDEKEDDSVSVIVLSEPTREMKIGANDPTQPRIRMENTFVRGRGKGLVLRSPRPFDWTVENTVFALDGNVLYSEPASRDTPTARATVKWKHVTAATSGPLLELRGSSARVLGLDVTCERCLLASSTRRRSLPPMILFADAEAANDPTSSLTWRGDNTNVYGNFDPLLEIRVSASGRSTEWDGQKWLRFTGESGRIGSVRFGGNLSPSRLRSLKPDDVKAELESGDPATWRPAEAGADAAKLLKPNDEK